MAFDCNSNYRKPLLFSDLFKNHRNTAMEKERHDAVTVSASSSNPSSSSTQFLSSWDSPSSSGFSTPLRSDFGSSEGDDADFIAELTRQMAECMLEEEDNVVAESVYEASSIKSELYSNPVRVDDPTQPNIQVYELKNQPPVSKESSTRGRRVRRNKSAQQKTEQQFKQYRGGVEWGGVGRNGYSGSGMQAVFIGGSGSRSGTNGTGVFLPRDPTEQKNKSVGRELFCFPSGGGVPQNTHPILQLQRQDCSSWRIRLCPSSFYGNERDYTWAISAALDKPSHIGKLVLFHQDSAHRLS